MGKYCSPRCVVLTLFMVSSFQLATEGGDAPQISVESRSVRLPKKDLGSIDLSSVTGRKPNPRKVKEWTIESVEERKQIDTLEPRSSGPSLLPPPPFRRRHTPHGFKRKPGRLSIDIQGKKLNSSPKMDLSLHDDNFSPHEETTKQAVENLSKTEITMSADAASAIRLARLGWNVAASFSAAFVATLRLWGPLIVARRSFNTVEKMSSDYMRGRQVDKSYTRFEELNVRYNGLPSSYRIMCRIISQLVLLFTLSKFMEWMVGVNGVACRTDDGGVSIWCGLLWIFSVVGAGRGCIAAVAKWGDPLRIQMKSCNTISRPPHISQWMQLPGEWTNIMSTPSSPQVDPQPMLFPVTWAPLRTLQVLAVASAESKCAGTAGSANEHLGAIMKYFLVSLTLSDEWFRVFIGEKLFGIGCIVAFCNFVATSFLVIATFSVSGLSGLMLSPTLVAVIISGWMNLVMYWNGLEDDHRQAAIDTVDGHKQAVLRALKFRGD